MSEPRENDVADKLNLKSLARQSQDKRLAPPAWVWAVLLVSIGAIAWVRTQEATGDGAANNVLSLILGFLAFVALVIWFLFFSGYSRRWRLFVLTALLLGPALFLSLFRVEKVTGGLVPSFRPRWLPARDETLPATAVESTTDAIDLATTTPNDFAQFLGPHRDGHARSVRLEPDWSAHPPELIWRRAIGAGWSAFAAVNGYAVTMEQRGAEELVTCCQLDSGKLVWSHAEETRHETVFGGVGPRSTPTIHQGLVYSLGATGRLLCLDGETGEVVWRDDLLQRYGVRPEQDASSVAWGRSNSPLIVADLVVVPVGGPPGGPLVSLAAFDRMTGEVVWQAGDRQVSYSSPMLTTLVGRPQILSINEDNISSHDPRTGSILWEYPWPGGSAGSASVSQPVVVSDSRVLLSKAYGNGAMLLELSADPTGTITPVEVWSDERLLKTKFTSAIFQDGFAYGLSDAILECVDVSNGRRAWRPRRASYGHGQILAVGDLLLVQAESGEVALVELSPRTFRELGKFEALSGQTWNNLCLYGDLLLVRNAEEAACYRLATVE